MSLPSRPESSQLRSAPRLASGPRPLRRDALGIGLATATSSPCRPHRCGLHESLAFLEFPCPSTFEQLQRPALQNRLSLHLLACRGRPACARASIVRRAYLPDSASSSGFRTPSTLLSAAAFRPCFMPVPSMGFRFLRRFLPDRSPRASRPFVSSVPLLCLRSAGFEDFSIVRTRGHRFVGLALTALAPSLVVVSPSRS